MSAQRTGNESVGREAAESFRRTHGLDIQPIHDLAFTVEQCTGLDVVTLSGLPEDAHGMTLSRGAFTMIGVPTTPHPMRQRSSVAHELGHVELGSVDREGDSTGWQERNPEEIAADAFARHFLAPLEAVASTARGRVPDERLLSDVVQTFLVSPRLAAIQLRTVGAIDDRLCSAWRGMTTGAMATRYGWRSTYQALVAQSSAPRPPRRLMARATEAYRLGLVDAAMLARMEGVESVAATVERLRHEGIEPRGAVADAPARPAASAEALSDDDLDMLFFRE